MKAARAVHRPRPTSPVGTGKPISSTTGLKNSILQSL
jgi:hypothetical protein